MTATLFKHVDIFDGESASLKKDHHVLVEHGKISQISAGEIPAQQAQIIPGRGRTLMPGLIDAHFHACLVNVPGYSYHNIPPSLLYPAAAVLLEDALKRGFTTVRDAGGADYGLAESVERGLIKGPRIFFSGRPLTQTGGHGDMRSRGEPCFCGSFHEHMVTIVDGVDHIRRAVREEFRKGANQIKMMLNGGVSSAFDPVWLCQFTDDEIKAAVQESHRRRSYVMAHTYMDAQIKKAVELGVRSIEHGNFLSRETARLMKNEGAFIVPTLVTYKAIHENGKAFGFTETNFNKLEEVMSAGLQSLENAVAEGVMIGFGTDLLGDMHTQQCEEFTIRQQVQSPLDILRSATSVNAALLYRQGTLGVICPNATADLLLINGNPLEDLSLFGPDQNGVALVMKEGEVLINEP